MRQPFVSEIMQSIESQEYASKIPKRFYDALTVLSHSSAKRDFEQLNETFMTVEEKQKLVDSYNLPAIPKTLALYACDMERYRRANVSDYEIMICRKILKYKLL